MENIIENNTVQKMIEFLGRRYSLRYNTLLGCNEYRDTTADDSEEYKPLDPRTRNRMALEVQLEGINASMRDVRNYLESDYIRSYNPIDEYLRRCDGIWDGHDHIAALANTVPTDAPLWKEWFCKWLLAMVDQWRCSDSRIYGNSVAPLLIAPQGYNKSTFCRQLLPHELAWGYTDSINIAERQNVIRAMSQQLLINLDEFNQISPKVQQGFLKNVIQLPHVRIRRPFASHAVDVPRTASFIATSNMTDILADPSGNRRFIGVELTAPINVSQAPNHRQLYAQALHMLRHGCRPWFDKAETQAIMQWNRRYEIKEPAEQFFRMFFTPAAITANEDSRTNDNCQANEGEWLSAAEIFGVIKSKVGASLKVTSLMTFGRKLANMPDLPKRRVASGMKYRVVRMG